MRFYDTHRAVAALVLMTGATTLAAAPSRAGRPTLKYAAVRVLYAGRPLPAAPDLRPYRDHGQFNACRFLPSY